MTPKVLIEILSFDFKVPVCLENGIFVQYLPVNTNFLAAGK